MFLFFNVNYKFKLISKYTITHILPHDILHYDHFTILKLMLDNRSMNLKQFILIILPALTPRIYTSRLFYCRVCENFLILC